MASLTVGSPAPDFSLAAPDGQTVRLADFSDRSGVVLIFYPLDSSPGCTVQLCEASNQRAAYEAAGVAAFGVNGGDARSHATFMQKRAIDIPLLVDADHRVAAAYGALFAAGPLKVTKRVVVGIDRAGRIAFYRPGMPPTREILAAFQGRAETIA